MARRAPHDADAAAIDAAINSLKGIGERRRLQDSDQDVCPAIACFPSSSVRQLQPSLYPKVV